MAFFAAAAGRFATGRFWPGTWMISSVGKDQFNNSESCILKIRPIVCFFLQWFWDCRSFYFHSLKVESNFLVSKRLLCLYDKKKNKTYLLVDMKFLFSYSTQHLTRSLCSLVSYRVKHSKGSPYLRAPMYYCLYIINNNNTQFSPRNRKQPLFHYMII